MNSQGIRTRNLEQYKLLHKQKAYGCTSDRRRELLDKWILDLKPESVLDYGCGQSTTTIELSRKRRFTLFRFDPAVEGCETIPAEAHSGVDLIISTHVLEHLDENEILDVLSHMRSLSSNIFLVLPTTTARQILPNGENAHATVQPAEWWKEKIALFFQVVNQVPAVGKTEIAFITWEPKNQEVAPLKVESFRGLPANATRGKLVPNNPIARLNDQRRRARLRRTVHGRKLSKPIPSVRGLRVAIVGKAASIIGSGEGALIDSYDIVVRVNQKLPIKHDQHKDMGSRTDILYTNHGVASTIATAAKQQVATEKYNKEYRARLSHRGGYTPFTGTVCIFQMLDRGASEVYVTGMDLYSGGAVDPSVKNGRLRLANSNSYAFHDPNGDKKLLAELLATDPRFKPNEKLRECLTQEEPLKHYAGKTPDMKEPV